MANKYGIAMVTTGMRLQALIYHLNNGRVIMMNVLVIGAVAENAANKLRQSPLIDQLHAIPVMTLWLMLRSAY